MMQTIRPRYRHTTQTNPRHYRRMDRHQRKDALNLLRMFSVGGGVFLAVAGAGHDTINANLPLMIFGAVIAMAAAIGLVDDGRR